VKKTQNPENGQAGVGKIAGRLPFSGKTIRIIKSWEIDKLRWFVTLTVSMSASYNFGDTPLSVLPSCNNFTTSEQLP
jgi:hypothetical protein